MTPFNILLHDFNSNKPVTHDIMIYLLDTYHKCVETDNWWPLEGKVPETDEEYKKFVKNASMYRYWSRCQYEYLMLGWPPKEASSVEELLDSAEKIDGYEQIKMNLDVVTKIFLENIKSEQSEQRYFCKLVNKV